MRSPRIVQQAQPLSIIMMSSREARLVATSCSGVDESMRDHVDELFDLNLRFGRDKLCGVLHQRKKQK